MIGGVQVLLLSLMDRAHKSRRIHGENMVLRVATLQKMTTVRVAYLLQALTNVPSVQLFLLPRSRIREFSVPDTLESIETKKCKECSSQDSHKTIQMHQDWVQRKLCTEEGSYPS